MKRSFYILLGAALCLLVLCACQDGAVTVTTSRPTSAPASQPTLPPTPPPTAEPTIMPTIQPTPSNTPVLPLTPVLPPTPTSPESDRSVYTQPGTHKLSVEILGQARANGDQLVRTFLLHIPPNYRPGVALPLVFNLHGAGGTASQQQKLSQMDATADREGFIVVYPQAGPSTGSLRLRSGQAGQAPSTGSGQVWLGPLGGAEGEPDMAFFRALIDQLQRELSVDPGRIYATGLSNGGTMANHLGCEMSEVFAAIAPVAGGHSAYALCDVARPVSVAVLHGTNDTVIPYEGRPGQVPPVPEWTAAWAQRDGCGPTPRSEPLEGGVAGAVTVETWSGCDEGAEVVLYTIDGGRHDWPGSGFGPPPWPEGMSPTLYATDLIWQFFAAHARSDSTAVGAEAQPRAVEGSRYQKPGDFVDHLEVAGYERWFTVHLPPGYDPEESRRSGSGLPLVVDLHPYGGTMFQEAEITRMIAKANEEGFAVVHPQALGNPPSWWGPLPGLPGQADRRFFLVLMDYLAQQIPLDPDRIYATGLSNGATMANALGCYFANTFAAIAPVAGGHADFTNCPMAQPVSVLVIHGTLDPTIPYEGRTGEVPPVHEWAAAWAERNGCVPEPRVEEPAVTVRQETWGECDGGVEVVLYSRIGGGHVWPGSEMAAFREGVQSEADATDLVWDFFEAHPRQPQP